MKQYVGISRDHSGSMSMLAQVAMLDYNRTIASIKKASAEKNIDTIVSVVTHQGTIERSIVNSNVDKLVELHSYPTPGQTTPLFESVLELVHIMEAVPDANASDVSFLVIAVTDGEDNTWRKGVDVLQQFLRKYQATDRWTFVFRVPRGYSQSLQRLGIPAGNIQEWEQTEAGMRESTVVTEAAMGAYFDGVKKGVRSTQTFYTNVARVDAKDIVKTMKNISQEVILWPVTQRLAISAFFEVKTGHYEKGKAFYQLSKTEDEVQDYKTILIRNKQTGDTYVGDAARQLLGLPLSGTIRLTPGDHGEWDIFVQSTSTNRILLPGTQVLYWKGASV